MSVTFFCCGGNSIHHSQMVYANRSNCCWWEEINQNNFPLVKHFLFSGNENNYFFCSPHREIPFSIFVSRVPSSSETKVLRAFGKLVTEGNSENSSALPWMRAIPPKQLIVGMHSRYASLSTENILLWIIFDIEKSTKSARHSDHVLEVFLLHYAANKRSMSFC